MGHRNGIYTGSSVRVGVWSDICTRSEDMEDPKADSMAVYSELFCSTPACIGSAFYFILQQNTRNDRCAVRIALPLQVTTANKQAVRIAPNGFISNMAAA